MAGRGTDIPLAPAVVAGGGLHVICCQHNASARIDRQLQGRCARQGDPGSVETILSLEDALIARYWPAWARLSVGRCLRPGRHLPALLAKLASHLPQIAEERRQRMERKLLLEQDDRAEATVVRRSRRVRRSHGRANIRRAYNPERAGLEHDAVSSLKRSSLAS